MAVYLNSAVGVFAQLAVSVPRNLERPAMPLENMRSIPVPSPAPGWIAALSAVYGEVKDETLRRLRYLEDDPVRRRLDAAVCEAMGWDLEEVAGMRAALAAEPSVTGKRA